MPIEVFKFQQHIQLIIPDTMTSLQKHAMKTMQIAQQGHQKHTVYTRV